MNQMEYYRQPDNSSASESMNNLTDAICMYI